MLWTTGKFFFRKKEIQGNCYNQKQINEVSETHNKEKGLGEFNTCRTVKSRDSGGSSE